LGEALMRTLPALRHEAIGLDRVPGPCTHHVGSITERAVVRARLQGVEAVIHTATLHKPHVATHSRQDFVDTNITGTLALLEEAVAAGASRFLFTSMTSTFGAALTPPPGAPAAWITEDVTPVPKNIYGATKLAAEALCELFARREGPPVLILRTSRFFPEPDDDPALRGAYPDTNIKANELLNRRADIADVVSAHLCALEHAPRLGFGRYLISATTPFEPDDLVDLRVDAPAVLARRVPGHQAEYARRGGRMFPSLDRVYVNARARHELGWRPRYDFPHVLARLQADADPHSPLARAIGIKGYHEDAFADGLYPVG
jgi:UDP-glucose 4-epimerase